MLQITVIKPKNKHTKKIILIICILIFILLFLIYDISFRSNFFINPIENTIIKDNIINNITIIENNEIVIIENKLSLPLYSNEAANKISSIYDSEYKRVFLTFDDGPSSNITPLILDVLKLNNVKATFFVLGTNVEKNASIVKRAYDEGHYIANHGYSHVYKDIYKHSSATIEEFNKTENCIKTALGIPEYNSYLFRFPGGSIGGKYNNNKKEIIPKLKENNICYMDWNCLTRR